jgi:hypothetical protein
MNSPFLKLNFNDLIKGVIVAILSAFLTAVLQILESNSLPTLEQLKSVGMVSLISGASYLIKNLLSNTNGEVFVKDETKDVKN